MCAVWWIDFARYTNSDGFRVSNSLFTAQSLCLVPPSQNSVLNASHKNVNIAKYPGGHKAIHKKINGSQRAGFLLSFQAQVGKRAFISRINAVEHPMCLPELFIVITMTFACLSICGFIVLDFTVQVSHPEHHPPGATEAFPVLSPICIWDDTKAKEFQFWSSKLSSTHRKLEVWFVWKAKKKRRGHTNNRASWLTTKSHASCVNYCLVRVCTFWRCQCLQDHTTEKPTIFTCKPVYAFRICSSSSPGRNVSGA